MTHNPPFTITVKAADYLAKIIETITKLEFGTEFKRDIRLHRKNRAKTIHSSLAIEGNALSLDEVTAVLNGKIIAGKQEEVKEVKNAYEAYDKIMSFDPYTMSDFLKAHKLMTQGLIRESGIFRSGDVGVFNGDVAIHVGARPQFVPGLIDELFRWAKESELHAVLKSAILHYEIETIHPFADGNGRMGRLWQTLLLAKWNEIFAWIPMESVLHENRAGYYQTIKDARKANNSGVFIEFTLSALLDIIKAQAKQINGRIYSSDDIGEKFGENKTQSKIMEMMKEVPIISARAIARELGITPRAVEKSIRTLKNLGYIGRVGPAKGGRWVVKKNDERAGLDIK